MTSLKNAAVKNAALSQRVRDLEKLVDKQASQIERMRAAKYKLALTGRAKGKGKSYCRVTIPDSHGSGIDPGAASAFLADLEKIKPAEVVWLGDHIDCGGFLAQHHTMGYVAQSSYTFEDDVNAANQFIDEVQKRTGKVDHYYIEGNHERRLEQWCVTQALKNEADAAYLLKMFSADAVLNIESRGMSWIRQGQFYDGVPVPSTVRLGHCYFTHGSYTGQHAASTHVKRFGGNVVFGHTHRQDSYLIRTVKAGTIGGWNPGCLCKLQPTWLHTSPSEWSHGYGLQLVQDSGDFLHVNIPIIEGKSLLEPMIEAMR